MRRFGNIPSALLASLVLSGILHAAAITSVPGINVAGFAGLFSERILSASLVQERGAKLYARYGAGKSPIVYSTPGMPAEDGVRPEEKNEEVAPALDGSPAGLQGIGRAAPLSNDNKPAAAIQDFSKEENEEETVRVAKYVVPEGAVISPEPARFEPGRVPGIISFKRERFSFEIYWLGVYVGNAVLEAVNDDGIIRITSQVRSAPFISTFYKVEDYAESRVKDGRPFNFRIRQHEGKYRSDKETIFDAGNGKITYYDYLKGTKDEHIVADSMLWDVISGFYYLRTKDLEPEKTVFVDIFDSNKLLNAEVNVLGRDSVKLAGMGDIDAVIVKPILKSDGLFQNKGDIRVWLSNDERRMPLRVETKVSIGRVTAELKHVETE